MKKQIKLLFPLLALAFVPLTSCSKHLANIPTGNIVFANYESYMSHDIMKEYSNDVTWLYYSSDDDIMNKFANNYDIAVPTVATILTLMRDGLINEVDWAMFELKDANGDLIDTGKKVLENLIARNDDIANEQGSQLDYAIQAFDQWLISDQGRKFLPKAYTKTHSDDQITILDWCVPYFFQSYAFAYWTDMFEGSADEPIGNSWEDTLTAIKDNNKISQPYNRISVPDEGRTIYGLSKLYENEKNNASHDINPDTSYSNEKYYKDTFNGFINAAGKNNFYLNSDSAELSNNFIGDQANKKGAGIISYNGDLVYAAVGLGQYDDEVKLCEKWIDAEETGIPVMQTNSFDETAIIMDGIVFNKYLDLDINVDRKKEAYAIVKDIVLDHVDFENPDYDSEDTIDSVDEDDNYIYNSMLNFDYVLYVSPWEAIDSLVFPNDDEWNGYFEDLITYMLVDETGLYEEDDEDMPDLQLWMEYLQNIYLITYPTIGFDANGDVDYNLGFYSEIFIGDLGKSNLHWAYAKIKHDL